MKHEQASRRMAQSPPTATKRLPGMHVNINMRKPMGRCNDASLEKKVAVDLRIPKSSGLCLFHRM